MQHLHRQDGNVALIVAMMLAVTGGFVVATMSTTMTNQKEESVNNKSGGLALRGGLEAGATVGKLFEMNGVKAQTKADLPAIYPKPYMLKAGQTRTWVVNSAVSSHPIWTVALAALPTFNVKTEDARDLTSDQYAKIFGNTQFPQQTKFDTQTTKVTNITQTGALGAALTSVDVKVDSTAFAKFNERSANSRTRKTEFAMTLPVSLPPTPDCYFVQTGGSATLGGTVYFNVHATSVATGAGVESSGDGVNWSDHRLPIGSVTAANSPDNFAPGKDLGQVAIGLAGTGSPMYTLDKSLAGYNYLPNKTVTTYFRGYALDVNAKKQYCNAPGSNMPPSGPTVVSVTIPWDACNCSAVLWGDWRGNNVAFWGGHGYTHGINDEDERVSECFVPGCAALYVGQRPDYWGCFTADTNVLLANGVEKTVDMVRPGDLLWNPRAGKGVAVKKVISGPERHTIVHLVAGARKLDVTSTHPMLTPAGYVPADTLKAGDQVETQNGWETLSLAAAAAPAEAPEVWNFTVEGQDDDPDAFAVVANGFVTGELTRQGAFDQQRAAGRSQGGTGDGP